MTESLAPTDTRPRLDLLDRLVDEVETVFHGKTSVVRLALAALLARGHILFEDVPGVGKTTLAHALAHALGLSFRRVQFTSDLLPSDVLGVSIYNPSTGEFQVREGPIFTHVLLADEINRAPPRTQSGLAPSRSTTAPRSSRALSWYWRRRTPSNTTGPIRCPRASSTGF